MQQAYEILGDERKRGVYDQYGMMGVEMFEKVGSDSAMAGLIFNPRLLITLFCALSVVVALIIMFLAFLSVEIEGIVAWSWATVFVPVWILDGCLAIPVIGLLFAAFQGTPPDADADDGADDDADGGDATGAGGKGKRRPKSQRNVAVERLERFSRLKMVALFACVLAWQILLVKQLDTGSPAWILVWVPLFVAEGLNLVDNIIIATLILTFAAAYEDEGGVPPRHVRILLALDQFRWWIVRTVLVIFIALRTADVIGWNWALVALPFFIGVFVAVCITFGVDYARLRASQVEEDRASISRGMIGKAVGLAVVLLLAFSFVGMLIVRLNETSPPPPNPTESPSRTVAVILTPIYIVASLLYLCFCCCLPCLACMRNPGEQYGEQVEEAVGIFRNRPQLYIEGSRNGPQAPWTVNMTV